MPLYSVKIINPNPYDINIKAGDTPNGSPTISKLVRAGQTVTCDFSTQKFLFYDRAYTNRHPFMLAQIQFNNQTFVIPAIPQ